MLMRSHTHCLWLHSSRRMQITCTAKIKQSSHLWRLNTRPQVHRCVLAKQTPFEPFLYALCKTGKSSIDQGQNFTALHCGQQPYKDKYPSPVSAPVKKLPACHKLSDQIHLAWRDVHSIQADTVGMLHLQSHTCFLPNIVYNNVKVADSLSRQSIDADHVFACGRGAKHSSV